MSLPLVVAVVAVVLAGGGAAAVLVARHSPSRAHATLTSTKGHSNKHRPLPIPLNVVSVTPAPNAKSVAYDATVTVRFNARLSPSSPLPTIRPAVAGTWTVSGRDATFHPAGNFVPYERETVTVPAGATSEKGLKLASTVTSRFTVRGAGVLRLQELLAELGYLPVSFTPASGIPGPSTDVHTTPAPPFSSPSSAPGNLDSAVAAAPAATPTVDREPTASYAVPLTPEAGTFTWRFKNIPTMLSSLWRAGQYNTITEGAVMAFESAHGLDDDGVAGPVVWTDLVRAAAAHAVTRAPYDYVYVSENSPEYVTVWRDGVNVYTTLANTGIPESPTVPGTWPVYARYLTTTMSGTNPDGSHYSDPGIPWVSYFHGGDALHGFLRASYGFPQSLGCVEMPFADAEIVWPYTPIGTLVTVEAPS